MKTKTTILLNLIFIALFTSCNIKLTESGKKINLEEDQKELSIAKESLRFIKEEKADSLRLLFYEDLSEKIDQEQLEWLMAQGKKVMDTNEYPNDTMITVSTTTTTSATSGKQSFKELKFPFINENSPDSTRYVDIAIMNGEIYKLFISSIHVEKLNLRLK